MVVNDYALVGGWVNHVAENVVPNTCWVDGDVFYARLNSGCCKVTGDDSVGFLYIIYSIVFEWGVLGDILRAREWYFWLGGAFRVW